jgi:transposase-like protein
MVRAKQPKQIHQMTVSQFEAAFPDEEHCDAYLTARRWPDGVSCPRCGGLRVYPLKTMKWKWQCPDCSAGDYRFSNIAGTIFENTNKPLREWFRVIHLMLTSKKGISARQIHRYMGFGSYKTAWYMCHRIRTALVENIEQLGGVVEIDETFVGGKRSNKHKSDRGDHTGTGNGPAAGKGIVIGAVARRGNVVARVIDNMKTETIMSFVNEAISNKVSLVCTDDWVGYGRLKKQYRHGIVDHSKGEYVVGAVHTNTIEGFWSLVKRGVVGTFHKVSLKYLPLYIAEFQFRHNNRHNPAIFEAAIAGC